jgi:hypothetical protein
MERLKELLVQLKCNICQKALSATGGVFLTDCRPAPHAFHTACALPYLAGFYAGCPRCSSQLDALEIPQPLPGMPAEPNPPLRHPVDFGDDVGVKRMVDAHAHFVGTGRAEVTPSQIAEDLARREFTSGIMVGYAESTAEGEVSALDAHGTGPAQAAVGVASMMGGLVHRIGHIMDEKQEARAAPGRGGASESLNVSGVMGGFEDIRVLLKHRLPSNALVERGYDSRVLLSKNVPLAYLLQNGYVLQDLLLFGFTWSHLKAAHFDAALWAQWKPVLPVAQFVRYYSVDLVDVLMEVCYASVSALLSVGFTLAELHQLHSAKKRTAVTPQYRTVASLLVHHRMQPGDLQSAPPSHFGLAEWHSLGLDAGEMGALGLTCEFARTQLRWQDTEFRQLYSASMEEILPRDRTSSMPLPKHR